MIAGRTRDDARHTTTTGARAGAIAALVAVAASCRAPTQIELRLTTDVPCSELGGVTISVGAPGSVETTTPSAETTTCDRGEIGTLVVVPSGSRDADVGVRVVMGRGVDVSSCAPPTYAPAGAQGSRGCIVARRRLRYLPHTPLVLPVALRASCLGVPCAAGTTCVEGTCRPADVDPSACADEDGCGEEALPTGGGGAGGASTTSTGAGGAGGASTTTTGSGGAPTTTTGSGGAGGASTTSTGAGGAGGASTTASARRVFVTSTVQDGNLGGLAGADQRCVDLAAAAGLGPATPGSWRAWLSDRSASPSTRFSAAALAGPWVRVDGAPVAADAVSLATAPLQNPMLLTETGAEATGSCFTSGPPVWTRTKPDGTTTLGPASPADDSCGDWTTTVTADAAPIGFGDAASTTKWASSCNVYAPTSLCKNQARLYCFEQ